MSAYNYAFFLQALEIFPSYLKQVEACSKTSTYGRNGTMSDRRRGNVECDLTFVFQVDISYI